MPGISFLFIFLFFWPKNENSFMVNLCCQTLFVDSSCSCQLPCHFKCRCTRCDSVFLHWICVI